MSSVDNFKISRITSSAPGRCGIVGNPSDMYSGSVISCSTAERAYCTIDLNVNKKTISHSEEALELSSHSHLDLDGGSHDLIKAAIASFDLNLDSLPNFALSVNSDIPRQSGLAGSTALMAAMIGALNAMVGKQLGPYQAAEMIRQCEFERMKTLCGFQDAYMVTFGGLQFMDFRDKTVAGNSPSTSPYGSMEPLHDRLDQFPSFIVAYTGVMHHSGKTHASLYERYCAGDLTAIEAASTFASFGRQGKRALIDSDLDGLASLMLENQKLIASVQPQNPANERLIAAAMDSGAMAAKLAGAGGGGSIIALTTSDNRKKIAAALSNAGAAAVLYPAPSSGLTINVE